MTNPYRTLPIKMLEMGQRGDAEKLQANGFEPYTPEAVPQYTAWIREDLVVAVTLIGLIGEDVRRIRQYLFYLLIVVAFVGVETLYHLAR